MLPRDKANPVSITDFWRRKHKAADADSAFRDLEQDARVGVVELVRADGAVVNENIGNVVLNAGPVNTIVDVRNDVILIVCASSHRYARIVGYGIAPVHFVGNQHHAITAVAALPVRRVVIVVYT